MAAKDPASVIDRPSRSMINGNNGARNDAKVS